jgi:fluoride ion exporter CrcB/FEX
MNDVVVTLGLTLIAGALGAVVRALVTQRLPRSGITTVNVAGTLLLVVVLVLEGRGVISFDVAFIVGIGFSGSLTTFSAWIGQLVTGLEQRPLTTVLRELLLPVALAVGLTVLTFATLSG